MNKLGVIFLSSFLYASQTVYTIQLFSSKTLSPAVKNFQKLPKHYQKACYVVKINKFYALRCYNIPKNTLKKKIKPLRKYFKDAFIAKMYKFRLNQIIYPKKTPDKKVSYLLYKADYFYNKGNLYKSLELYKKAYKTEKNPQIAVNISYIEGLLGKTPTFYTEKTLYAYSIGAIKSQNYNKLSLILEKNRFLSNEGYIDFVLGYLNEKNPKKALIYYKTAFEKNPTNRYFIYAYARILDINKEYKKALEFYKQINSCDDSICKYARIRIRQIEQ